LVSTYGGFAYLGPFLGVPAFAVYSRRSWNPAHHRAMERASADLNVAFEPVPTGDLGRIPESVAGSWNDPA
jgi:hypothetical protein